MHSLANHEYGRADNRRRPTYSIDEKPKCSRNTPLFKSSRSPFDECILRIVHVQLVETLVTHTESDPPNEQTENRNQLFAFVCIAIHLFWPSAIDRLFWRSTIRTSCIAYGCSIDQMDRLLNLSEIESIAYFKYFQTANQSKAKVKWSTKAPPLQQTSVFYVFKERSLYLRI